MDDCRLKVVAAKPIKDRSLASLSATETIIRFEAANAERIAAPLMERFAYGCFVAASFICVMMISPRPETATLFVAVPAAVLVLKLAIMVYSFGFRSIISAQPALRDKKMAELAAQPAVESREMQVRMTSIRSPEAEGLLLNMQSDIEQLSAMLRAAAAVPRIGSVRSTEDRRNPMALAAVHVVTDERGTLVARFVYADDAVLFCTNTCYVDKARFLHMEDRAGFYNLFWGPLADGVKSDPAPVTAKVVVADGTEVVARFVAAADAEFFIGESAEREPDRTLTITVGRARRA